MNQPLEKVPPTEAPTIREFGYRGYFAWCAEQMKKDRRRHKEAIILCITVAGKLHFGVFDGFDSATHELTLNRGGAYGLLKVCSDDIGEKDYVWRVDTNSFLLTAVAYGNSPSGRQPNLLESWKIDPHYWVSHADSPAEQ
ncbi:MAG: hypothetical protein WCT45_00670 [Candidatus Paceibacterota bacterium]|jgi:hypothetical protein